MKALPDGVEAAYVTSCDVPLLVPGFVAQMLALADGYDIALIEIDGFAHPLSAVYRRSVLPQVEELLAQDRLRPAFLFDLVRTRRVAPAEMTADPRLWTLRNLNTRDDYERALADAGITGRELGFTSSPPPRRRRRAATPSRRLAGRVESAGDRPTPRPPTG